MLLRSNDRLSFVTKFLGHQSNCCENNSAQHPSSSSSVSCQCDQMARLCLQYLALYNSELNPNNIKKLPKKVHNFAKY